MHALLFTAFLIITAYLAATIIVFGGIPQSISQTYYLWRTNGVKFLFTAVMWIVGILTIIYWLNRCEEHYKLYEFLPFLSVSGMCFVGAACAFRETLTRGTHFAAAGVWAASAIAFFALVGDWPSIVIGAAFGLSGYAFNRFKNLTFWAEIAVVLMMFVGLYVL